MTAVEFIKQYGWDYAKLYANGWITFDSGCIENDVSRDDVKQLVDAWELVNRFGGLFESKKYIDDRILPELSRSIELVESANE